MTEVTQHAHMLGQLGGELKKRYKMCQKKKTYRKPCIVPSFLAEQVAITSQRQLFYTFKHRLAEAMILSRSNQTTQTRVEGKSEKAMAPHSSTFAQKIPWMEEPGRLQSMGLLEFRTRLGDFTFTFHFHALEKEMATHSSVLAWRIPGTGKPGGLPSMGSHRVGHD